MANIPERLVTALADRYPIEREVGSGGMATVYLARDLKLGRLVALKVLRPDYLSRGGVERFLREIDTVAKLTHPHILPLHDSGEADGFLYYVMPYVEGESLRERLERETQLQVEEAVQITRQVADALSYAHAHGVIHRDIKPENILLEEGEAVVADFGIARAITAAAGETLTDTGIAIGTPHYMSPEQGSGDRDVDARTDIYALGCVLYEMLSGQPPFVAPTARAVIARHISEPPPSLSQARPEAPGWLDAIIHTALAKAPDERFPTAEALSQSLAAHVAPKLELRADPWARWLRRLHIRPALALLGSLALAAAAVWLLMSGGTRLTNIGVLPLQDLSEEDNSILAAGFTASLIKHLADFPQLATVSFETMSRYHKNGVPLDSIVERHNLQLLIEGTLIATEEQIQVWVSVTDAHTGAQVGSMEPLVRARYDEQEMTTLESRTLPYDFAQRVARLLRRQLGLVLTSTTSGQDTDCRECEAWLAQAIELKDGARPLVLAGDTSGAATALWEADSLLALAEAGDRDWVDPIIERAWVAARRAGLLTPDPQTYDPEYAGIGIAHADRALEHETSAPRALEIRGILRSYLAEAASGTDAADRLWQGAEVDLARAVELNPSRAAAWSRLSRIYRETGRFAAAKRAAEEALAQDAWLYNDESIVMRLCEASLELEQFEEANHWCIQEGRQRFPRRPGFVSFELLLLASSVGPDPDVDRAWQLSDMLVERISPSRRDRTRPRVHMDVASVLARAGLSDSARAVIRRARAAASRDDYRLDYREANARIQLGEPDEAIRLLALYLRARPDRKDYIAKDWWWKPLRNRADFQALIE